MILLSSKLITCKEKGSPIDDGAVAIKKSVVLAAGPAADILKRFAGHQIHRLREAVLLPGLINVHTHLELPALLNSIRGNLFSDWLVNLIYAKKKLRNRDYVKATRKNIETLIHTGTTTVGEICTHGVSPALLKQSSMRALVFHELINMGSGVGGLVSGIQLQRGADSALIKSGLAPHTPYTVSEPALREIIMLARKSHLRITMHVAESKDEIKLMRREKSGLEKLYKLASWDLARAPRGESSVEYLNSIGFLSPNLLAVHAVQVTDADIMLIKKPKVSIAHCPRSNKETHVGRMPLRKLLDAGITVGLGTDSLASSPNLNMWDEMRFAYLLHRRDGITAKDIFTMATSGGAKALDLHKEIGTLEPGKKADIIAVSLPNKNTGDLYSDLLRETKSCNMTMVNGKILHRE